MAVISAELAVVMTTIGIKAAAMRIGAVDNEKRRNGKANRKPKEQRGGFHDAPATFGMGTLTSVEGRSQGFFGSEPWMANANSVPANQYPRKAMATLRATPVDRLHRRLWPLREHNCEITVTARTIAGKILCHQLSIGVKHSSTAIRASSSPNHSASSFMLTVKF